MSQHTPRSPNAGGGGAAKPKGRRKRYVIAAIVLVLVAIVALGPTILSTGPARTRIFSHVGTLVGGRVSAEGLSLSWFGSQRVDGLSVETADGEEALSGLNCTLEQGLASLAIGPGRLGRVRLANGAGRVENLRRLGEAPSRTAAEDRPEEPAAGVPPGPLPLEVTITGFDLHATDATVHIKEATFKTGEAADTFDAAFAIRHGAKTGTGTASGTIRGLSSDWQGPEAIGLDATLKAREVPVSAVLGVLAALDVDVKGGGVLAGNADVKRDRSGRTAVTTRWTGTDVWATGDALNGDRPELKTLDLTADLELAGEAVTVRSLDLTTPVATARAKGTFDLGALLAQRAPQGTAAGDVGEATAVVNADLAAVSRMFPNTIGLHEDVQLTGGQLTANLAVKPGTEVNAIAFAADVKDVAGRRGEKQIALAPINVEADVVTDRQGLNLRQMTATSVFGRVQGSGRLDALALQAELHLDEAMQEVSQFVDLGEFGASGDLVANVKTSGTWGESVRLDASAEATDLALAFGEGSTWQEPRATFAAHADLAFDQAKALKAVLAKPVEVEAAAGTLSGTAAIRRTSPEWTIDVDATGSGSLGKLSSQIAGYLGRTGRDQAVGLDGTWHLQASAQGKPTGKLTAGLRARTTDLAYVQPSAGGTAPGRATSVQDVDVTADLDTTARGQAREVLVRKFQVEGHGIHVQADGRATTGAAKAGALTADGKAEARFDLAKLSGLLESVGVVAAGSRLAGTAAFDGSVATRSRRVEADGTLDLANLDVHLPDTGTTVVEDKLVVPVHAVYLLETQTVDLRLDGIQGKLASGKVHAAMTPRGDLLDIEGDVELDFDGARMRRALGTALPPDMEMAGPYRLTAAAKGPVNMEAGTWNQMVRRLDSEGVIQVARLTFRGVRAEGENQQIRWTMGEGKVTRTADRNQFGTLAVNEGTVTLDGEMDLKGEEARFRVEDPVEFAREVQLTGELAREMLAYLSPLLGSSVSPRGRLSMTINRADIPMGENMLETASFDGVFSVADFQTTFGGPFAFLAKWLGAKEEIKPQTLGPVHVQLKQGLIYLDEQAVTLQGGLKLRVDGTVRAADGAMNVMVTMPLTEGLLERFGVKADRRFLLTDKLVRVPLTGTVTSPRLDEKRLGEAVLKSFTDILRPGGGEGENGRPLKDIGEKLKDLFKKPKEGDPPPEEKAPEQPPPEPPKGPPPEEKKPEQEGPEEKKPREELRDFFKDIFKKPDDD